MELDAVLVGADGRDVGDDGSFSVIVFEAPRALPMGSGFSTFVPALGLGLCPAAFCSVPGATCVYGCDHWRSTWRAR